MAPVEPHSPRRLAGARRSSTPTAALFVRIPSEQARRLDRAAFELGLPKQEVVSGLLERYVDPDSPESLAQLVRHGEAPADQRRRVTVETLDSGAMTVGHHSFRPREPEVLTLDEAAELLQVEPELVRELAQSGDLPARRLGEHWRIARTALLRWLEDSGTAEPVEPER